MVGQTAARGSALAVPHPDRGDNRRIACLAIATFLGVNGDELEATDPEIVTTMVALAAGRISADLASWLRKHVTQAR